MHCGYCLTILEKIFPKWQGCPAGQKRPFGCFCYLSNWHSIIYVFLRKICRVWPTFGKGEVMPPWPTQYHRLWWPSCWPSPVSFASGSFSAPLTFLKKYKPIRSWFYSSCLPCWSSAISCTCCWNRKNSDERFRKSLLKDLEGFRSTR